MKEAAWIFRGGPVVTVHRHDMVAQAIAIGNGRILAVGPEDRVMQLQGPCTEMVKWIRGWGYDHSKLAENRHPDRWDLDEVSAVHPVLVSRICGHILAVNSLALEKAGLTR